MFGISAAIYASFFLGLSNGALKKSYKDFAPSVAFFFDAILGLFIWVPAALFFGVNFSYLGEVFIFAILSAIMTEVLFFYALSKGKLSVTTLLLNSYPIYTVIFSYFLNGERLSLFESFYILLTILGTALIFIPKKFSFNNFKRGEILWPIIAAIAVGLSDTLSKGIINRTHDFSFLFALAIVQLPVSYFYLKIEKQNPLKVIKTVRGNIEPYKNAIFGGLFNIIGTGLMWISFTTLLASIAAPIVATSGVIGFILAVIFMNEKLNKRTLVALFLVLVGIMGLSAAI
ncbi:MAG TPA: DMT family transporter [Patescibacteria group bacterium]|nr:DMT family transporter [Patescibacteria group bacterium]